MAGRTTQRAVENFLRPIQRALSCVTDAQIRRSGEYDGPQAWTVAGGHAFLLPCDAALLARITQHYRVIRAEGQRGPWKSERTLTADSLLSQFGSKRLPYNVRTSSAIGQPRLISRGKGGG